MDPRCLYLAKSDPESAGSSVREKTSLTESNTYNLVSISISLSALSFTQPADLLPLMLILEATEPTELLQSALMVQILSPTHGGEKHKRPVTSWHASH